MMYRTKMCSKCNTAKSIHDFSKNRARKDGYEQWCKKCINIYRKNYNSKNNRIKEYQENYRKVNKSKLRKKQAEYRNKNKEIIKIRKLRDYFKITYEQAQEIYNQKINGVCDICKEKESSKRFLLSVDHNHKNGKIRGLLCNNCNRGLGHFKDNIENLQRAIKYLNEGDVLCHR